MTKKKIKSTKAGDPWVLNVQRWANNMFDGEKGYTKIAENGLTGYTTIYALLHGLQITLEVGSTANNFGTGTENAFKTFIKNNGPIQERTQEEDQELNNKLLTTTGEEHDRIYKLINQYERINGIIQGALLCKGYAIGATAPTGHFYGGTAAAIRELKEDAGIADTSSVVTLNIMKALLSMEYFYSYDTSERVQNIITMQRYLNRNYEEYIGLRACDGVYSRGTNIALIYAIQAEENMPPDVANGNCGPSTKKYLPTLSAESGQSHGTGYDGKSYTTNTLNKFKILANMALYFNGYGSGELSSTLEPNVIKSFQRQYSIEDTGNIDYTTWLSLLVSCGDTSRTVPACDCATIITQNNIKVLKTNKYKYIGRYLCGTYRGPNGELIPKGLSVEELELLYSNGINVFPIFQGSANYAAYFTKEQAIADAEKAYEYVEKFSFPFGTVIYFAVDYDATGEEIKSKIIPYFEEVCEKFMDLCKGLYRVGIYGTRNMCTQVCNKTVVSSSFVGDMSTGFSGNLGFSIPDNWAYDQFYTTTISSGTASIEIDKDAYSGRNPGSNSFFTEAEVYPSGTIKASSFVLVNRGGDIPVYESKEWYNYPVPTVGPYYVTSGEIIGYIRPNDFYISLGLGNPKIDNVHRVIFNDGSGVKLGYITCGTIYMDNIDTDYQLYLANYSQILPNQESFSCVKYNPSTNSYENVNTNTIERTLNQPVAWYDVDGKYLGVLPKGTKVVINRANYYNTSADYPWCVVVNKIIEINDHEYTATYVIDTGLSYGSSGSERAWY